LQTVCGFVELQLVVIKPFHHYELTTTRLYSNVIIFFVIMVNTSNQTEKATGVEFKIWL